MSLFVLIWVVGIIFVISTLELISRSMSQKIFISILLFFLFTAATWEGDRFREVLSRSRNDTIRQKLLAFQEGGIEKAIDSSSYHPDSVLAHARSFLGTPHKMGGSSLKGIDCSGLVMVAHKKYGVSLPRTCQEQARYGRIIVSPDSLLPGDLVFFCCSFKCSDFITHSGIYAGDGSFIHTSYSKGVIFSRLQDHGYWEEKYLFGTRLR